MSSKVNRTDLTLRNLRAEKKRSADFRTLLKRKLMNLEKRVERLERRAGVR